MARDFALNLHNEIYYLKSEKQHKAWCLERIEKSLVGLYETGKWMGDSSEPHLQPGWNISGQWLSSAVAEPLGGWGLQSIPPNKIFPILVPGFPLDCSSSTSSSNRPQPAVSMSSKGIVVSSVQVTPGRSLQKMLGKGHVNSTKDMPKGDWMSYCFLLPRIHSWILLAEGKVWTNRSALCRRWESESWDSPPFHPSRLWSLCNGSDATEQPGGVLVVGSLEIKATATSRGSPKRPEEAWQYQKATAEKALFLCVMELLFRLFQKRKDQWGGSANSTVSLLVSCAAQPSCCRRCRGMVWGCQWLA